LGDGVASQAFEDFKNLVNFLQSEVIFIGMPKTIAEPGAREEYLMVASTGKVPTFSKVRTF